MNVLAFQNPLLLKMMLSRFLLQKGTGKNNKHEILGIADSGEKGTELLTHNQCRYSHEWISISPEKDWTGITYYRNH